MKKIQFFKVLMLALFVSLGVVGFAQHGEEHQPAEHAEKHEAGKHEEEFNLAEEALAHIANANAIHVFGDFYIPLPAILYAPGHGWSFFMTSKFDAHHHGNGEKAIDHYVMKHGVIHRIADESFPYGEVAIDGFAHGKIEKDGKEKDVAYAVVNGKQYLLDEKSTLDGGMLGGGKTSYMDFSLSKGAFTMLLVLLLAFWLFRAVAKGYERNKGKAPSGVQSLLEPVILFIRDEVAIPFIGKDKYERYFPFLLTLFFFILGLNLIGQFPLAGNVTGNFSFTMVLAIITALYVNFSGNKNYWEHVLWMPGVPSVLKVLILTPVEILGVFIKPFTLMLRLFANIAAGHIVLVAFVGLIFIFGHSGESVAGAGAGTVMAFLLSMFMMAVELLVAFVQAFVFTLLAAAYFGAATEEAHH